MDHPLPIGHGATISAPHMHASALELLKDNILKPGDVRVMDVGSGSGYLAACFAHMLQEREEGGGEGGGGGRGGGDEEGSSRQQVEHKEEKEKTATITTTTNYSNWSVVGIDHIPELVEKSKKNVERDPACRAHLKSGHLKLFVGDGRLGWKEGGGYDAIHVGAAAPDTPHELLKQLKPGGRMVAPVGPAGGMQVLAVYDKDKDGRKIHRKNVTAVAYVPLTGKSEQLRGSWIMGGDEFEP
jgi:protein-L-isoaspartate(D-aspartate) O-methyltransferase